MVIKAGFSDKCPFCGVVNKFETTYVSNLGYIDILEFKQKMLKGTLLILAQCAECDRIIITYNGQMIFPLGANRNKCPEEVPENLRNDYEEACLVEPLSKKAAAALSRRCLQNLLHEQGFKDRNLDKEINLAIESLPSHLASAIDAIRQIGNYAAHPMKSDNTGEIVDVECGEAEWVLDVLEGLFDFYYVQPKLLEVKRKSLNKKLKELGKPELK